MNDGILVRKVFFDVNIQDKENFKLISNKLSQLINTRLYNFLEKKFSKIENLKIDKLEIDLGVLNIKDLDDLENIFKILLNEKIDTKLTLHKNFKERTVEDLIFNYLRNNYLPWWIKDRKIANDFLCENINKVENRINLFNLITFNLNYFKKTLNLFDEITLDKYLRIMLSNKYDAYCQVISFKNSLNDYQHLDIKKSFDELQYESLMIVNRLGNNRYDLVAKIIDDENKENITSDILLKNIERHFKISLNFNKNKLTKPTGRNKQSKDVKKNGQTISDLEAALAKANKEVKDYTYNNLLSSLSFLNYLIKHNKSRVDDKKFSVLDQSINLNSVLSNKESLFDFIVYNFSDRNVIIEFINETFIKNYNNKIGKIFSNIDSNIKRVENFLIKLQEKSIYVNLNNEVFKSFLRFSIIRFLIKTKKTNFQVDNFLITFFTDLRNEKKLNNKNIYNNILSTSIELFEGNMKPVVEIFIDTNQYQAISEKNKILLNKKSVFHFYLENKKSPNWHSYFDINQSTLLDFFNELIKNKDSSYLELIFSNKLILKNYLNLLINNHDNILLNTIELIGDKNHLKIINSFISKNEFLYIYFNNKLWQNIFFDIEDYFININKDSFDDNRIIKYNFSLENIIQSVKVNNKEIDLYKIFIEFILLIKENKYLINYEKIISFLEFLINDKFHRKNAIYFFISYLYINELRLFSKILKKKTFLDIFNNENNLKKLSKINLSYDINESIQIVNSIDKFIKDLNNNKLDSYFDDQQKINIFRKFDVTRKFINKDINDFNFEYLKYYIEIGSYPITSINNSDYTLNKLFFSILKTKPVILRKYCHEWSKNNSKFIRVLSILNSKKDFVKFIDFIYPNMNYYFDLFINNLNVLKIDTKVFFIHSNNYKKRAELFYKAWADNSMILYSPANILKTFLDIIIEVNNLKLEIFVNFFLKLKVQNQNILSSYQMNSFDDILDLIAFEDISIILNDLKHKTKSKDKTNFINLQYKNFNEFNKMLDADVSHFNKNLNKKQFYLDYRKNSHKINDEIDFILDIKRDIKINDIENKLDVKRVSDVKDGLLISNCGLIIFWPFLYLFFKRMGLIHNEKFKDKLSISKALISTNFFVTGISESDSIDDDLILNKILCGVELDFVLDSSISLNSAEINICNSLMKNIISQWGKIKSTDSLREWFLVRQGVLTENDNSYVINVNKKPQDLLLKELPWKLNMISSKLIKKRIKIIWNY